MGRQLLVAFTGPLTPPQSSSKGNSREWRSVPEYKNGDTICVTEPIKINTITWNQDLCMESYDSDGDIDQFFDAVADEEYI